MDCVVGYHLNPLACGIAKFNSELAQRFDVPLLGISAPDLEQYQRPLLSIKLSEFADHDIQSLEKFLANLRSHQSLRLFLHAYSRTELERRLIQRAEQVYCGNREIVEVLRPVFPGAVEAWCPGTLLQRQRFQTTELSVFSFGMAHKIQAERYHFLDQLLRKTGKSYCLYLSTALHEGTTFEGSFAGAFDEIQEVFCGNVYFVGYLSDAAVYNYLHDTTYFAAFFSTGVRANNTSVNAALDCGSVVLTNLDSGSPGAYVHGANLIDLNQCQELPTEPKELRAIGARAKDVANLFSWDALIASMSAQESDPG